MNFEKYEGQTHVRLNLAIVMRERVVIKWGGGLITDKSKLCTPNLSALQKLAEAVSSCCKQGFDVLLVHGAGSYGHLRAKRWKLQQGYLPEHTFSPSEECSTQYDALELVRREMLELNQHVCDSLRQVGLEPQIHPPHIWAKNTGVDFHGDLGRFEHQEPGEIHVTFGDVVDVDGDAKFGILSGDDLVVRLAVELPNVQRLVFAIGGVDGLLRVPPEIAVESDLIEVWSPDVQFEGTHHSDIDVTGGIGLKAARGAYVAEKGIHVFMVNGDVQERVLGALLGKSVRGTEVVHKQ
ncbi:MAG: hypothetical protein CL967_08435 [Euryarchaeota archaeon]|nr:hypothetical protein [Euryarchaeota archaeon]